MEIDRIKINDDLMCSIVNNLFNPLESVERFDLPISKESIDKFILEWNKPPQRIDGESPHISFISDNAHNDLRVYMQAHDANYKVNINDVILKTRSYTKISNMYNFHN